MMPPSTARSWSQGRPCDGEVSEAAAVGWLARPRRGPVARPWLVSSELADRAGAAQPGHQLINEPGDAAGGVGRALAQPGMQQLAAVGAGGQQRMVAQPSGGAVGGALPVGATEPA